MRATALHWQCGSYLATPSFTRTKPLIGMPYMTDGKSVASITARLTALTVSARTKWKAISHGFAAWLAVSIIQFRRATFTNMRRTLHGWKIIAASTTARWRTAPLASRSATVLAGTGKGIGSADF